MFTVPTILTYIRIALIPLIVAVYLSGSNWATQIAAIVFILAGITDWLDGYLARRLQQTTAFGAFLDPVADKLMVAIALMLIIFKHTDVALLIPALIIVGREITVSALREWMAELGQRKQVAVSSLGKIKTTVQIIAIVLLLWEAPIIGLPVFAMGKVCLYIAAILTVVSMINYMRGALRRD